MGAEHAEYLSAAADDSRSVDEILEDQAHLNQRVEWDAEPFIPEPEP